LAAGNAKLTARNAELTAQNAELTARTAELARWWPCSGCGIRGPNHDHKADADTDTPQINPGRDWLHH